MLEGYEILDTYKQEASYKEVNVNVLSQLGVIIVPTQQSETGVMSERMSESLSMLNKEMIKKVKLSLIVTESIGHN